KSLDAELKSAPAFYGEFVWLTEAPGVLVAMSGAARRPHRRLALGSRPLARRARRALLFASD
ncbi:MAG: hypothetical protein WAL59_21265, partial [Roseiarcus sp.]